METKIPEFRGHFELPSPDASTGGKRSQKGAKMDPKWSQNGTKMTPRRHPKGAKCELDLETSPGMPRGGKKAPKMIKLSSRLVSARRPVSSRLVLSRFSSRLVTSRRLVASRLVSSPWLVWSRLVSSRLVVFRLVLSSRLFVSNWTF